ncbi:MAG: hypothetical protein L6R28_18995 [Planctomycetes bacterium]|nr:hypothetical protein [Planctomycetota bacterium]
MRLAEPPLASEVFESRCFPPVRVGRPNDPARAATAVRRALEDAPDLDRQLMVLFYGGGMGMREIAREMALPRIAVAARIDETTRRIRRGIRAFDPVAAELALDHGMVLDAICAGEAAPPNLYRRVVSRIEQTERRRAGRSGRLSRVSWVQRIVAGLLAGAALGALRLLFE